MCILLRNILLDVNSQSRPGIAVSITLVQIGGKLLTGKEEYMGYPSKHEKNAQHIKKMCEMKKTN